MSKIINVIITSLLALIVSGQMPDKVSLEQLFMETLVCYQGSLALPVPDNLQRIHKNLYVSDFGYYKAESVRAVSYFRKTSGQYKPIRERSSPVESIVTLLSGYTGTSHYTVSLKQHCYNYQTIEVEVPLNQLLAFCIVECGFVPYVGIESEEGKYVTATLFLVNKQLGYSHTFMFRIDPAILEHEEGLLPAEAYTFTPINNLAP